MSQSYAADLHIHGTYSRATSDRMVIDTIADQAEKKGLDIVGTGDILHPSWISMVRDKLGKVETGTFRHPDFWTNFLLTVEIEDNRRVHHLIILPSLSKAEELREKLDPHSSDMNIDGRPTVNLKAQEIVELATESDCLIGPSHAFTPWTSVYKEFDSLEDCYKDQLKNADFLELGLSADSLMADRIKELKNLTFLSNSDAHSPWPNKLGREFNRFDIPEPTFSEVSKSIRGRKNIQLNVGLNPRLGKYHLTACSKCYQRVPVDKARSKDWKCEKCGGNIKKGVSDRVEELADFKSPQPPDFRPRYVHTAPLSEVISLALNRSNPRSKKVQLLWDSLVERFGDEISVLVDAKISEIREVSDSRIADMIQAFRDDLLEITPGGGGEYGNLEIPTKVIKSQGEIGQKTLSEFGD